MSSANNVRFCVCAHFPGINKVCYIYVVGDWFDGNVGNFVLLVIASKIDKTPENSTDKSKIQKIYTSMEHMSTNEGSPRRE